MKPILSFASLALPLALVPAAAAPAPATVPAPPGVGDYRQDLVPADANTVVHVDLQQLRRTRLWQLLEEHEADAGIDELDELRRELGFDPLQEIHSVTAYRSGNSSPTVAVIVASGAIDGALERLPEVDGYRALSEGGIDFFAVDEVIGSVHELSDGNRIVVVAETLDAALRGHRVLHGEVRTQEDQDEGVLRDRPREGSFLFFATRGDLPGLTDELPASPFFELAQGIRFDLGEAGGALFASAGVQTASLEDAQNVRDLVSGFLALGKLMAHSQEGVPPEALSLLRSVDVGSHGEIVSVDVQVPLSLLEHLAEVTREHHR